MILDNSYDILIQSEKLRIDEVSKMTIRNKLALSFGILILILLITGLVSEVQIDHINKNITKLAKVQEPLQEALLEMEIYTGEIARAVSDYVRNPNIKDRQRVREVEPVFLFFAAKFIQLAEKEEQAKLVEEVVAIHGEFMRLGYEIMALADKQYTADDMNKMQGQFEQAFVKMDKILDEKIRPWVYAGTQKLENDARNASILATKVIFIMNLFGLIIAIAAAIIIIRAISIPITKLKDAALEIGKAKFGTRVDIRSRDELSTLANAFNQMVVNLDAATISKNYFENIIRSMVDTLVVVNPDATIKTVNKATLDLLGYEENELIGKRMGIIFAEESPFKERGFADLIEKGSIDNVETVYLTKDGQKVPVIFSGAIIRGDYDKIEGIVCSAKDITERKKAQQELNRTQVQLIQSEKLSSIGTLAAGVAHEIGNSLTVISGRAKLSLLEKDKNAEVSKSLRVIEGQTARASKIMHSLLKFARPGKLKTVPVNLNQALEETLSLVEHKFSMEDKKIVKDFDQQLPEVPGDISQLQQVFLNLILNAEHAMPGGGALTITTRLKGAHIEIEFADTGKGISKENINKLFDPFFTTRKGGTGLGLSVSYGIIKEHKGSLNVKSEPDKGSTFTLRLPVVETKERV